MAMMKKYLASIWAYCDNPVFNRSNAAQNSRVGCLASNRWLTYALCRWFFFVLLGVIANWLGIKPASGQAYSQTPYTIGGNTSPTNYPYPSNNAPRTPGQAAAFQQGATFQAPQTTQFQTPFQVPQTQPVLGYQQPGFQPSLQPPVMVPSQPIVGQTYFPPQAGAPQQIQSPFLQNPPGELDLDVYVPQTQSGRFSLGGTYGSDNGLVGAFIIDERDFDIRRWPRNFQDVISGNAWRGNGEHFRAEIVPGNELERYLVSWSNPYFRNTDYSLSVSGYLFDRSYFDWDERRVGGKVGLGRRLSNYVSVNAGLRMDSVTLDTPRVGTSPQLNADLGNHNLFLGSVGLVYDTRVTPFNTGVGSYLGLTFSQAFGDYSYSRGEIDFRNFQTIYQRPDGSGRHSIELRAKLGFSGSSTPVFENFFAGGMTSLRGFDYRGVSPIDGGVRVGGEFQWLNSLEYKFPLTADDMIHGVMFVDFGTVEESVELNSENFRVAPGVGLRVDLPYAGLAAPLAFDFAFPISTADGDDEKSFGFLIGIMR